MVAHLPSKQMVASSSLVSRSNDTFWLKPNKREKNIVSNGGVFRFRLQEQP